MRSQRQLRVGEEIRHSIANILMRNDVPWPQGFSAPVVTVTEVQISPDLKNATIFIMPLGGVKMKETVTVMNAIVGHFRHMVAQEITLRYTPKFKFMADESFEYAAKINKILHAPDVARDLENDAPNKKSDDDKDE
jgi:ribosome-binding factor A